MVAVTVVVPTVGRPSLRAVLSALRRQADDSPLFEVLVVSDGAALPADLAAQARHPACERIAVLRLPRPRGVSAARNLGVRHAGGPFVGFLDDDVRPDPSWIGAVASALAEGSAATGRILEDGGRSTLSRLRRLAFDHRYATVTSQETPGVDFLNGGNCAVRLAALRSVGGFDEAFPKSQDRELARRLVRAGHRIAYDPALIVRHRGDYTWRGLWRGRHAAGRANAVLLREGDTTAVGPGTARETYGRTLPGLLLAHGPRLAAAATVAVAAEHLGRRSRSRRVTA